MASRAAERAGRRRRNQVAFTTRGSSVLAAAIAAGVGAFLLGETDLLRVAMIVVVLCLATWLLAKLRAPKVLAEHRVAPVHAPVGSTIEARVRVRSERRASPASIVCHELVSDGLTPTEHLAVDPARLPDGILLAFTSSVLRRGEHRVGGLQVTTRDAFGLVSSIRTDHESLEVLGVPRTFPVNRAWLRAIGPRPAQSDSQSETGLDGEPDIGIREHRPEDGMRRVHWRSTARTGRLMTRQDAPTGELTVRLGYDSRGSAHRGTSFERTLEVVASLAIALLSNGYRLRLFDANGLQHAPAEGWSRAQVLRRLALASTDAASSVDAFPSGEGAVVVGTSTTVTDLADGSDAGGLLVVIERSGDQLKQTAIPAGALVLPTSGAVADLLAADPRRTAVGR